MRDRRRLEHRSDAHRIALEVGLAHLLGGKPATLAERVADVERRIAELQSVLLGGDDPIEHPMPRVVPPPDQWLTVNNKETS